MYLSQGDKTSTCRFARDLEIQRISVLQALGVGSNMTILEPIKWKALMQLAIYNDPWSSSCDYFGYMLRSVTWYDISFLTLALVIH